MTDSWLAAGQHCETVPHCAWLEGVGQSSQREFSAQTLKPDSYHQLEVHLLSHFSFSLPLPSFLFSQLCTWTPDPPNLTSWMLELFGHWYQWSLWLQLFFFFFDMFYVPRLASLGLSIQLRMIWNSWSSWPELLSSGIKSGYHSTHLCICVWVNVVCWGTRSWGQVSVFFNCSPTEAA